MYCHRRNSSNLSAQQHFQNFEKWERDRIRVLSEKNSQDVLLRQKLEEEQKRAAEDRKKAADSDLSQGRFEYSNGDVYEGTFLAGMRHGRGTMSFAEDCARYEGEWFEDLHHGQGSKHWSDGISYEGEWRRGKMHGLGVYTMTDGFVMKGLFEADEFLG